MAAPVLGADIFAKLCVQATLSLGVAVLGCGKITTELADPVTLGLRQVQVTSLVDDLEALLLSSTVIEQVYGGSISESLAGCEGADTRHQAAENLRDRQGIRSKMLSN